MSESGLAEPVEQSAQPTLHAEAEISSQASPSDAGSGLAETRAFLDALELAGLDSVPGEAESMGAWSMTGSARSGAAPETATAPPPIERVLEAICFVEGRPVSAKRAAEFIPELTEEQFERMIAQLERCYREQGRPYGFVRQQDGYLLTLRPQYRFLIQRLYGERKETVLSQAAIEVLAIIAYNQPVARSTIDALRGRDSAAVIRQLLRRGLIAVQSSESVAGPTTAKTETSMPTFQAVGPTVPQEASPASLPSAQKTSARPRRPRQESYYVTTPRFLALFGLRDLQDLPRTDDLQIL